MRFLRLFIGGVSTGGIGASIAALVSPTDNVINSSGPVRFARAALTAGSIVVDYRRSVYSGNLPEDPEKCDAIWSNVHKRSAEKLLELCGRNKGVFVKVGQHLAALDYLLPTEYIETLRILHSQAPYSSLDDVFKVLKQDLKLSKEELFEEFDECPIGAASLAQVYKAKLRSNGEIVAVKIQHLNVRAHSHIDIKTMDILVQCAAWIFPDFKLLWLAEEMKKNLPQELDFLREGQNSDRLKKIMKNYKWLRIPKVYWDYSSSRILIMEFCEGGQVNDLAYINKNKLKPIEITSKLGSLFSEMIFVHGFLHCDPHPGNILVRNDKDKNLEIVLLDHGLYSVLSDEIRYNYSHLWLSILSSNVEGIKTYSDALGVGNLYGIFTAMITARSWQSITSSEGIAKKKITDQEQLEIRKNVKGYVYEIAEVLDRIPRPMIMILKTNDLLRNIEHTLKIQKTMSSFMTMSKFCVRAVYAEEITKCDSKYCVIKKTLFKHWSIFKIQLFETYVWLSSALTHLIGINSLEY